MVVDMSGALHVLTVHYNTPELTSRLVSSFPERTPHGRIIYVHVFDNASEAENRNRLRERIDKLAGVTLELSESNIGFGEGINALVRRPEIDPSDVVWIINADTRLDPGCLQELEKELDAGNFDVLSPLIYHGDSSSPRIWFCGGSMNARGLRIRHQLFDLPIALAPSDTFETEFLTGAAPMMRASTFHAVGGFPHEYFLYCEDALFSWRARELGFRLGVVPSALLWHAVGASSGFGQSLTFYYWSTRNRFALARDIGIPRRQLIWGSGGLESLRLIAKALLEREKRRAKVYAALKGTFDGVLRVN